MSEATATDGRVEFLSPDGLPRNRRSATSRWSRGASGRSTSAARTRSTRRQTSWASATSPRRPSRCCATCEPPLEAAGAEPEHVVKWNVFIVEGEDFRAGYAAFQRVWGDRPDPPDDPRRADQGHREVETSPHPARVGGDRSGRLIGEVQALEELVDPTPSVLPSQVVQVGHQLEVLLGGEEPIHRGELPGHADHAADGIRVARRIVAVDADVAGVGRQQRREDVHGCVFPAPFGPSSAKTAPAGACRSTPSSATVSPNVLRKPVTSRPVPLSWRHEASIPAPANDRWIEMSP
jgi:enamine deaminase RidA (YjgF/YER057c/UK114 family)